MPLFSRPTTRFLQELCAEFTGTFVLALAVVLSSVTGAPTFQAIAFALTALTFALNAVSSHFNPAVTMGALLSGAISLRRAAAFVAVQTIGGTIGALIANEFRRTRFPSFNPTSSGKAFLVETIYTGALVLVMQNAGLYKHAREPNSYYGLAIGFVVAAGVSSVGYISGGVFNPAIGTAIDFATLSLDASTFVDIWLYWLAPFTGAAIATLFQLAMNRVDHVAVAFPGWLCRCRCGAGGEAEEADGRVPLIVPATEFVGTFFLCLTASLSEDPLAIGFMLASLIYALDHVSADFNPAVTIAVAVRRGTLFADRGRIAIVILSQTLAAFSAALLAFFVAGDVNFPSPAGARGDPGAVFYEGLWTALLVLVVCSFVPATATSTQGAVETVAARAPASDGLHSMSHHGLAVGLVITSGIYCATGDGSGSGGVFNPSLGVGIVVVNWWALGRSVLPAYIYVVGPLCGAFLGAGLFRALHAGRDEEAEGGGEGGAYKAVDGSAPSSSAAPVDAYGAYGGGSWGGSYGTML